jgi:hypothetical protein
MLRCSLLLQFDYHAECCSLEERKAGQLCAAGVKVLGSPMVVSKRIDDFLIRLDIGKLQAS